MSRQGMYLKLDAGCSSGEAAAEQENQPLLTTSGKEASSNASTCLALQALGFHVWVAELELLVGTARGPGQAPSAAASLELLLKLQATLQAESGVARVREYQRRCEDALVEMLLKGAAPPVPPPVPRPLPESRTKHACKN